MNYEKQIEDLCGFFLKERGLTVHQVFPRGYPEYAEHSLLVFRDHEGQELLANIEIMDSEPELKNGYLQTYDAAYATTADGCQFEFISNYRYFAIDPDTDLGLQLFRFLQANVERKRRTLVGEVHRSNVFYQACLGIEEISGELGLRTKIFKKGNARSQLTFTTEDGRTGDIYMSAGRLRFAFDDLESSVIDYMDEASIRETVQMVVHGVLEYRQNGLGK